MRALSIVHVASEMDPLAKVGGLADVVSALAAEQARAGHRVWVVLPAYASIATPPGWAREPLEGAQVPWGLGHEAATFARLMPPAPAPPTTGLIPGPPPAGRLEVLLVGHAGARAFFGRAGIYDDPSTGAAYSDNGERFLFFCRAALAGLERLGHSFDVIHAHDHQAAWVPCFLRTHLAGNASFSRAASIFTVHNLGYQGIHDSWVLGLAGFGGELFYPASPFEYWGRVNYMKVGLGFADLITTVSPTYAKEIQSSAEYGSGLEGVLKRRSADLRGILNGIDDEVWNPARDPLLPYPYDREQPAGKWKNRAQLLSESGFSGPPEWPVVGMVTRLVDQKGLDLLEQAEAEIERLEARFVVLGMGQTRYQDWLRRMASMHPERVHCRAGFDERFAHLVYGGSDLFLMPSRYEPCGLGQLYSLRYGTVPVVRATGGLADTVKDFDPSAREGTGFLFHRYDPIDMVQALRRAFTVYRQPHLWTRLRDNGMACDFTWRKSAAEYDGVYCEGIDRVREGRRATLDSVRATLEPGRT